MPGMDEALDYDPLDPHGIGAEVKEPLEAEPVAEPAAEMGEDEFGRSSPIDNQTATAPDAKAPHSEGMVDLAKNYGFSDEQIALFPDDASLRVAVQTVHSHKQQMEEANRQQWAAYQQQQQQNQYQQQQQPQQRQLPPMPGQYVPKLPEGIDPELAAEFNRVADYNRQLLAYAHNMYAQQFAQLSQGYQQLQQQSQSHAQERYQQAEEAMVGNFDSAIAALGGDYEHLLGKGGVNELARDSLEVQERQRVLDMAATIGQKHPTQMSKPELQKNVKMAVNALYASQSNQLAQRAIKQSLRQRQNGILTRPMTANNGSVGNADQRAIAAAEQHLEAMGLLN